MCSLVGRGTVGALLCASNFLHGRTALYPVSCRSLSFSPFQPPMSIILTRSLLVLLSISNFQTGEPIPVAPVEHVQLCKVKCSRVRKSGTPSLLLRRPDMHPCRQFPGHFVVHMPSCSLSCFVPCIPCLVIRGTREPSLGVGSLGVRGNRHTQPRNGQRGRGVLVKRSAKEK